MEQNNHDGRAGSYLPFVTTVVALAFLVLKMVNHGKSNQSRRPEGSKSIPRGPWGLPIIGNAHQLGKDPHKVLFNLSKIYGDVFLIKLGSYPVVVLNRASAIKDAFISQTIAFAGRPSFLGLLALISVRGGGIGPVSYDKTWKMYRELLDKAFLDFSDGDQVEVLESRVRDEASGLLSFLFKEETSVNCEPKKMVRLVMINIMAKLLFNIRREFDHPDLQKIIADNDQALTALANANTVNYFPFLKCFLFGILRKLKEANQVTKRSLDAYIEESMTTYTSGSKENILHYLRTLVTDLEDGSVERLELTDSRIHGGIYELFGAGYETVSITLTWAFLYLVNFPDLQKEIQDEIDKVVGRDRVPSLADREKLPLIDAFIAEVYRHATVIPLVPPHKTTQDTVLGAGYDFFIPKDTIVFMNLYSIHKDPKQWTNPDLFDPNRFLLEDGGLDKQKVSSVMQLGGGIRRCVGIKVAPIIMLLLLSNILHQCSLKSVGSKQVSMEGTMTFATVHPPDYQIKIERR